ncbi:MAG: hypothetical protein R3C56_27255 [Pirellulaceae bacterium]
MLRTGGQHAIGVCQRSGHRLFYQQWQSEGSQAFDPYRMIAGGRTDHQQVRPRFFDTVLPIGKQTFVREPQVGLRGQHARAIHIAQADHFTVGMFGGHPQIVPHVHMLKRYSRHTKALIQLSFSCLRVEQLSPIVWDFDRVMKAEALNH